MSANIINEHDLMEKDIEAYLKRQERKELLRFLTCGSVDDGKSTLIGRLLHDTKLIYEDQLAAIKKDSEKKGSAGGEIDLSLLVDGLAAEREQGITIDVAYRYFSTSRRKFIIADTPGHEQYTRNMATGASTCDLAVILIDARKSVLAQTKRHSFICTLLGIQHILVAINKMDLVDYSEDRYLEICDDYKSFSARLDLGDIHFIPISALKGDNIVDPSENMPWHQSGTLLNYLETVHIASDRNFIDARFPIQYVNRPHLNFRGYAGSVASGLLRVGDEIMVIPGGKTSKIKEILSFDGKLEECFPPLAVTLTLEDEIDASRGDMFTRPNNIPTVDRHIEAMIVWMAEDLMSKDKAYLFKINSNTVGGKIADIRYKININELHSEDATELHLNEVARCHIALERAVPFDTYRKNRSTGAFIIIDRFTNNTIAAGMIIERKTGQDSGMNFWESQAVSSVLEEHFSPVSLAERTEKLGQNPKTILLTGLTGAGKTEIAYALERRLFDMARHVTVLDGDNIRLGLCKDLGFTTDEKSEHLRRVTELAKIMNQAGLICICAFVAPDAAVRERMKKSIGEDRFLEVYLSAPLKYCASGKAKDYYKKAKSGELYDVPGVSAPYDIPTNPDLVLDSHELSVDDCVDRVIRLL